MAIDTTKPLVLMGGAPSLERTMKETGYDPDGAVLAAGGIPEYTDERVQTSLNDLNTDMSNLKYVLVPMSASGWSGSAPYTQTVSVSGMTADWVPGVPSLAFYGNVDVTELITKTEALGCIKMITSAAGTLTFTAPEDKPGVSLTLRVPGQIESENMSTTIGVTASKVLIDELVNRDLGGTGRNEILEHTWTVPRKCLVYALTSVYGPTDSASEFLRNRQKVEPKKITRTGNYSCLWAIFDAQKDDVITVRTDQGRNYQEIYLYAISM